jgi:hypothetical protein
VDVEEFSGVICVVPGLLKPNRKIVLVEALGYKLWIAASFIISDKIDLRT